MKTQAELRAFALGMMAGIGIFVGVLFIVSWTTGIKWQPVLTAGHHGNE